MKEVTAGPEARKEKKRADADNNFETVGGRSNRPQNEIAARKQWPRSSFIGFLRRGPDTDHRAGARATKRLKHTDAERTRGSSSVNTAAAAVEIADI